MPKRRAWLLAIGVLAVALPSTRAQASSFTAEATWSDEKTTEITEEGTTHEEVFTQTYNLAYETALLPTLNLSLDFTLDVTDTTLYYGEYDTGEIAPALSGTLEANWWSIDANWDQSVNTFADPAEANTVETTWDIEFTVEPLQEYLPSVNYSIEDDGEAISRALSIEENLEHSVLGVLDLTFDASQDNAFEPEDDSDTRDRSYQFTVAANRTIGSSIKLEGEWNNERQQSVTLSEEGDPLERDDTLSNNVRGQIVYNLLEIIELTLDREVQWDKDLEVGPLDVTDTWTGEATYDQELTRTINMALSYTDDRENARPGEGFQTDSISRDYSAALELTPMDNITFTPSFDRSTAVEWSDDPEDGGKTSDTVDDTWEFQLDYSFWEERAELSVSRTIDLSKEFGEKTAHTRNWDLTLNLGGLYIPNLELTPEYSTTQDQDLIEDTTEHEETVELGINYEIGLGDGLVFTLDHTYSRTQTYPAEGVTTVERSDDTDLTLAWNSFLSGMSLELTMTRSASDTSKDDAEAVIDYTYSATYDYEFLSNYTLSVQYDRDVPQESEDSHNVQTTFSSSFYDGLLTLDLEHEFEKQLEGEKLETHRYLIEIQAQF